MRTATHEENTLTLTVKRNKLRIGDIRRSMIRQQANSEVRWIVDLRWYLGYDKRNHDREGVEVLKSSEIGAYLEYVCMYLYNVEKQQQQPRRRAVIVAPYTGRIVVDRLIVVIVQCPSIAPHAVTAWGANICVACVTLRSLVNAVISAYENVLGTQEGKGLPPVAVVVTVDMEWVEDVTKRNVTERTKLEVELKMYTNNMIKESIRMGHRDLRDFFRSTGEFGLALKHYTKSREFCSTSQHVLDMCMSVLELTIEQRTNTHIPS
ncbi:26S proteasome subunit RPN7-domain-containing protein [Pisolithus marmoratus]|nr:26S proteasome subunit RPN7-domain-containing protein [Pisolithus marmoratus]